MIEWAANEKLLYIFLQKDWRQNTDWCQPFIDATPLHFSFFRGRVRLHVGLHHIIRKSEKEGENKS